MTTFSGTWGTERGEGEWDWWSLCSFKVIDPIMESPTLWPQLNLITPQSPHLQILSHWWAGLQHMNLGGQKQSTPKKILGCTYLVEFCGFISSKKAKSSSNIRQVLYGRILFFSWKSCTLIKKTSALWHWLYSKSIYLIGALVAIPRLHFPDEWKLWFIKQNTKEKHAFKIWFSHGSYFSGIDCKTKITFTSYVNFFYTQLLFRMSI